MFNVTVIILRDIVESVIDEKDEVLDIAGGALWRLLLWGLLLDCNLDTTLDESVDTWRLWQESNTSRHNRYSAACNNTITNLHTDIHFKLTIIIRKINSIRLHINLPSVPLSIDIFVCRPVVEVILLEASSSDSKKLVVSRSELSIDDESYPWPLRCLECPLIRRPSHIPQT